MITKPAISMQVSSIPYLKPVFTDGRWNKLYDQNTKLHYYTLSTYNLLKKNYNITDNNDIPQSNKLLDPLIKAIKVNAQNQNQDDNVLVLTGTKGSKDGFIYLDKYNTDNEDSLNTKCNNLRDTSDYEFLTNYYNKNKNIEVIDIDNYYQNIKFSDLSESESVGCLKKIIIDFKLYGNISSIIFAWSKSEYTQSLLDAIYSIDCDVQKSLLKEDEYSDQSNEIENSKETFDKITKIKRIYDLTSIEKGIIKKEHDIRMREYVAKLHYMEAVKNVKYVDFNLDYDDLKTKINNEYNNTKIKFANITNTSTQDLRHENIQERLFKILERQYKLLNKEADVIKIELDSKLIDLKNKNKSQD